MEKQADPPIHDRSNVIPFRPRKPSHSEERKVGVREYEVDILLCSLCGSGDFHLLADLEGQIGCASCGFLIGATWIEGGPKKSK